ncbi:hypothetical protein WJX81_004159 [Elliptochloris bilobata]|uniref:Mitochondrial carrier protein n=1 Tax=Elliptochloris bilobata TaxID=381761 RepID=A0AAW1SCR5_9CHLO
MGLSSLEHTAIGAVAGLVEVTVMQPTVAMKNALQEGRPVPWSPLALYRGYAVNAASIVPITAVQMGANRYIESVLLSADPSRPLSPAERIGAALTAGATSAVLSCPAELLMIQQQRTGESLLVAARRVGLRQLYRGLSVTAAREGIYTGCYLGLSPAHPEYNNWRTTVRHITQTQGTSGLWAGLLPRGIRVVGACMILQTVRTRLIELAEGGAEAVEAV